MPIKGNKKRAQVILDNSIQKLQDELSNTIDSSSVKTDFYEFLQRWLIIIKASVQDTTFSVYQKQVNGRIKRFFYDTKKYTLEGLKPNDIQEFYFTILTDNCTTNTVIHYHAIIRKSLQYAVKNDLIDSNPADKVEKPQKNTFIGSFYSIEETQKLFECMARTKLEIPTLLACFYGLRRSEVLGLRWSSIDFSNKVITINHVVTNIEIDGVRKIRKKNRTKTKSSFRSLPLVPEVEEKLLQVKLEQQQRKKLLQTGYSNEFLDYICVDELGKILKPDFITKKFKKLLIQYEDLRIIRFHDLRHTCASLLLASDVSLKEIQDWLGHSDFSTTANIYAHLDSKSKKTSASAMSKTLNLNSSM
ncbi:site-specific integrase [Enterococcus plantarum]|uniref:tyrosine-type recombinase/integrase n=1 Tax=Enterococcus plantarum TaxID=1077675 RepID=UPI001A8E5D31|nr:site-specific integrase [Enterococcus plantarum]MBO0468525.1 site-specific integrase [Enterococcus plantarum]